MTRDLDGTRDPWAFFGSELRRVRMAASLSQAELGQRISFSGDMVGKVEACERKPTPAFAAGCDKVFDHLNGLFTRLLELARRSGGASPLWFRPWLEFEREATSLFWWEPLMVPGLLQTAGYARAILASWPDTTDDEVEELVAARMERQAIFDRERPAVLCAALDEAVLRRLVGSPEIMREQLLRLADMSARQYITVQVVPAGSGASRGCSAGSPSRASTAWRARSTRSRRTRGRHRFSQR